MKRRTLIKNTAAVRLFTRITPSGIAQQFPKNNSASPGQDFLWLPSSAFPQTWWRRMKGNVTKEGSRPGLIGPLVFRTAFFKIVLADITNSACFTAFALCPLFAIGLPEDTSAGAAIKTE